MAFAVFISNQVHDGHGGAIALDNSKIGSSHINSCLYYNDKCTYFENNRAEQDHLMGENLGGAIYAINQTEVGSADFPFKAYFKENKADHGAGIYLLNQSTANIQNSYFISNGELGSGDTNDNSVIKVHGGGSEALIRFSTFAHNSTVSVLNVEGGGVVDLRGSIVNDINPGNKVLTNDASTFNQYCNIYHEIISVGFIVYPTIIAQDPGFVDVENSNYHLKYSSDAVDRCDLNGINEFIRTDLDGDSRAIDIPAIINGPGAYDVGADEYNDVIFSNSFEPGASSGD